MPNMDFIPRDATPDEEALLRAYEEWSEECFAAGFISPDVDSVRMFRDWLKHRGPSGPYKVSEDYEEAFLRLYRELEELERSDPS